MARLACSGRSASPLVGEARLGGWRTLVILLTCRPYDLHLLDWELSHQAKRFHKTRCVKYAHGSCTDASFTSCPRYYLLGGLCKCGWSTFVITGAFYFVRR